MPTKKARLEKESGSKIRIAGETYTLWTMPGNPSALPKGKDCSKQMQTQTLPKGSDCSRVVPAVRSDSRRPTSR